MASYINRLQQDIRRWVESGLIDEATGRRLSDDVTRHSGRTISFGKVLAIMAAILMGASILLFVGANWDAIPRIARVTGLFALIAAGFLGGALVKARGHDVFGECLYLLGTAAFGGGIALVGQMYHLSGDETQAVLTWCVATMIAAFMLRSALLTNVSAVLAIVWLCMRAFDWSGHTPFPYEYLGLGALIAAVSYWTGAAAARHLLLLSVFLYAMLLGQETSQATVGVTLALLSAAVFLAAYFAPDDVEKIARLGGPYPAHSLVGFLVGIGMVQVEMIDNFGPMLVSTLIAFGGIVAALLMRGRQSRLMRWIAYAAFTIELAFLYLVTLGTMIDTAGLFLFSGVALAAVAYFIIRVERRISVTGGAA